MTEHDRSIQLQHPSRSACELQSYNLRFPVMANTSIETYPRIDEFLPNHDFSARYEMRRRQFVKSDLGAHASTWQWTSRRAAVQKRLPGFLDEILDLLSPTWKLSQCSVAASSNRRREARLENRQSLQGG
jgi:hypothetical protein